MPKRDPYPMTSVEAKALEASVQGSSSSSAAAGGTGTAAGGVAGTGGKEWSSMETQSDIELNSAASSSGSLGQQIEQPPGYYEDMKEASTTLVEKKPIKGIDQDDIYADTNDYALTDDDDVEDPILDVPLDELRGTPMDRFIGSMKRNALKLYKRLYGDKLPPSEMIRTLTLATTLFFMIGGYWLLRSLKDSVLIALCGYKAIPKAKMLSVFVVLGVVTVYNHLLDSSIPKHQLFYVFGTFYFCLFTAISILLMDEKIGLENKYQSEDRYLGWVSYCAIESFGSVMVSLFWSFANSNITLETAKASYGVMVATAQLGSILGPAIVKVYAESWGLAKCYLFGAMAMLLLQGTMYTYIKNYGTAEDREAAAASQQDPNDTNNKKKKKERAGILEGLYLFAEHNYVKGIFAISCLFMVEVTIVDFTMKVLANEYFADEYPCDTSNLDCYDPEKDEIFGLTEEATNALASFMGLFGVATNSLSFIFSLLGTSAVIRYLGLRLTLLLFPSLCLIVIIIVRLHPTLYVVFFAMIMLKANSYALNNPTKEILYQPTSSAVRYKAKSWIDIFGARGSKALGSVVTNAFSDSAQVLVANGSLVGMTVATFLIWNARFMGKKFDEYTESGYIVGEENNPESNNIAMAIIQNNHVDTSCALKEEEDDDEDDDGDGEDGDEKQQGNDESKKDEGATVEDEEEDVGVDTGFAKKPSPKTALV